PGGERRRGGNRQPQAGGGTPVQNALAQSSNTAFTDLAHRVSTTSVIEMANNFGVDIDKSGLTSELHQAGLALGISALTVNEQTTMLSAIDDNGVYHKSHIVGYWQEPDGPEKTPALNVHNIFNPDPTINAAMDSQVQYAMEMTTVTGTGTAAAYGLGDRQIIAKTGTTSNSRAGFFIGAIPQYSLVVGMFTASQSDKSTQSITPLGGGGFGGARPAETWNIFARAEFAGLPSETFQNPVFTGAKWNQIGKLPKPKPTVNCVINGKKVKVKGKTCPTPKPTPTPTPSCSTDQNGNYVCGGRGATPSPGCTYEQNGQYQCSTPNPTATPSPSCTYDQNGQYQCSTPNPTATPSPTCTYDQNGQPSCGPQGGPATQAAPASQAAPGAQASLAVSGAATVLLPGSLLRTTGRRRRRNRRRSGVAK
ncbi:MAG TPA: penicillin-binding transpeptidase domain-containing protein, partial [Trebonia sp.]